MAIQSINDILMYTSNYIDKNSPLCRLKLFIEKFEDDMVCATQFRFNKLVQFF